MFTRWNTSQNYWEYDTSAAQDGAGPWLILPNSPFLDKINIFSANQNIEKTYPSIVLSSLNEPIDKKRFEITNYSQFLYFHATNDSGSVDYGGFTLDRLNNLKVNGNIYEQLRNIPIGHWLDYSVDWIGGDNSVGSIGNGALLGRYTLIGRTCNFQIRVYVNTTTVMPTNTWNFGIPYAFSSASATNMSFGVIWASGNVAPYYSDGAVVNAGWFTGAGVNRVTGIFGSLGTLSRTVPFTWGAGCFVFLQGCYEF